MKALVLFSGGLDSSVCLGLAVKEYGSEEVLALSIYYGQKHKKEMREKQFPLDLENAFQMGTRLG